MKGRLALAAAGLAALVAPLSPGAVERWYSTGLYPRIQAPLTHLSNLVPVALLDVAAAAGLAAILVVVLRRRRDGGWGRALLRTGGSLVWTAIAGYLVFLLLWGLNYRRVPLAEKIDYERSRITPEAAVAFADTSARALNAGFREARPPAWELRALAAPFGEVQRQLGAAREAVPGVPKRSLLTLYFRRAAIDGMTDPFFLEIIVNPDVLPVERPFVVAHEWAHLAGYADEADANFVAWLTCLKGDPVARYSGWMAAYEQAMRVLPREARRRVTPLDAGPSGDLRAIAERYRRSSPAVRQAARGVYDQYLRANRVAEGIDSYDAVLRLMLGTRFDADWTPRRR